MSFERDIERGFEMIAEGLNVGDEYRKAGNYVTCSKCRTSNPPNAEFCSACGANLTKRQAKKGGGFKKLLIVAAVIFAFYVLFIR